MRGKRGRGRREVTGIDAYCDSESVVDFKIIVLWAWLSSYFLDHRYGIRVHIYNANDDTQEIDEG